MVIRGIWFKSSAINSLTVSMKIERRLEREGEPEKEAVPGTEAIAA